MTQSSSVTGNRWTRVIHNYIFFTFILDTFGGPSTIMDTFGEVTCQSCQVQQQATDQTKSAQQMLRHPAARLTDENTEVPLQPYGKKNAKK